MPNPPPYRPSEDEPAFLIEWAAAIGVSEDEARATLVEMEVEGE